MTSARRPDDGLAALGLLLLPLAFVLTLLALLMLFPGCGRDAPAPTTPAAPTAPDAPTLPPPEPEPPTLRWFGITLADRDALLADQSGRCALCDREIAFGGPPRADRAALDHDGPAGEPCTPDAVRGILCSACNWSRVRHLPPEHPYLGNRPFA